MVKIVLNQSVSIFVAKNLNHLIAFKDIMSQHVFLYKTHTHTECPLVCWMSNHAVTHPGRVLLHLMLVAMRAAGVAAPEAVLAELVTAATEAAIAEACHSVAATVGARDGMIDWQRDRGDTEPVSDSLTSRENTTGLLIQEKVRKMIWQQIVLHVFVRLHFNFIHIVSNFFIWNLINTYVKELECVYHAPRWPGGALEAARQDTEEGQLQCPGTCWASPSSIPTTTRKDKTLKEHRKSHNKSPKIKTNHQNQFFWSCVEKLGCFKNTVDDIIQL